jgi:predicted aspartyl protease
MEIAGEWQLCEDGVTRPMVSATVTGASFSVNETFLIDTGADRTVLSAKAFRQLGLTAVATTGVSLQGISGNTAFVSVTAALEFDTQQEARPSFAASSLHSSTRWPLTLASSAATCSTTLT